MSTRANDGTADDDSRHELMRAATVEAYETEDGVVFYDPENPLAWVETTRAFALGDVA